jgi:hypothetical protein
MDGNSESVSEKPRRGRPCVIPEETRAQYAAMGLFDDITTERSRHNVYYRQRACLVLQITDPVASAPFRWLADIEAMRRARNKRWRATILTELGRINDEDQLRAIALAVCERKPRAREAITLIRKLRRRATGNGTADGLRRELIRQANDYLARHPGMPWSAVAKAARGLLESIEATASREIGDAAPGGDMRP